MPAPDTRSTSRLLAATISPGTWSMARVPKFSTSLWETTVTSAILSSEISITNSIGPLMPRCVTS